MGKYRILVESAVGKFFEETFEETSGSTILERVTEIITKGYQHADASGKYDIAFHLIKTIKITVIN